MHQFRIIYRFLLPVGFQINPSKRILFIELPFTVLKRAQLVLNAIIVYYLYNSQYVYLIDVLLSLGI